MIRRRIKKENEEEDHQQKQQLQRQNQSQYNVIKKKKRRQKRTEFLEEKLNEIINSFSVSNTSDGCNKSSLSIFPALPCLFDTIYLLFFQIYFSSGIIDHHIYLNRIAQKKRNWHYYSIRHLNLVEKNKQNKSQLRGYSRHHTYLV